MTRMSYCNTNLCGTAMYFVCIFCGVMRLYDKGRGARVAPHKAERQPSQLARYLGGELCSLSATCPMRASPKVSAWRPRGDGKRI